MTGAPVGAAGAAGSGPRREPFLYALLRAVPSVERGETLNVGVLLYCQNLDYLAAAVHVDVDRLRALAPTVDVELLCAALDTVAEVAAGQGMTAVAAQPVGVRFGWLTAPRSTIVQCGPVHSGLTDDPAGAVEALLRRLVH